jgi:hypothetical protein
VSPKEILAVALDASTPGLLKLPVKTKASACAVLTKNPVKNTIDEISITKKFLLSWLRVFIVVNI